MGNNLKSMLQIRRMLQLLSQGKGVSKIAQELGVSVNTVKKYRSIFEGSTKSYTELQNLGDEQLGELVHPVPTTHLKTGREIELQALLADYHERLANTHITRELLWAEYRRQHPAGYSYSQFCTHLSQFKLHTKAVMHLDHKPGDVLEMDFAGDTLFYIERHGGNKIYCVVLVCVLPFSSFCYAEALRNMSQQLLIGAMNRCLQYMGGTPRNICSDNMKQYVNKADKYEPEFSELIDQFALHYDVSLTATRVLKPRDKASVERHVGIVYSRIYAHLEQEQFYSLDELNVALRKYLDTLNLARMQGKTQSRREIFEQHESPVLRPLPAQIFEIKHQTSAKVKRDYHVILGEDWHNYSVPYKHIGKRVKLVYDSQRVEIYLNHQRIALHRRNFTKNAYTTQEEHRPQNHKIAAMIQKYQPQDLIQKAALVGPSTQGVVSQIIQANFFSDQLLKSCLGILRLGSIYGNERLENACRICLLGSVRNYMTIKNILKNNRDKLPDTPPQIVVTNQAHANVRGSEFFAGIGFDTQPENPKRIC